MSTSGGVDARCWFEVIDCIHTPVWETYPGLSVAEERNTIAVEYESHGAQMTNGMHKRIVQSIKPQHLDIGKAQGERSPNSVKPEECQPKTTVGTPDYRQNVSTC
jgi:tRNA 2-selenouridine synthase SelU